jgi:metal-responsive CopG/Arc/MetJ family transcriptional regulator
MNVAISIEDAMLREADETARRMGLSRSRLFALAVGEFPQRHRQEQMLVRLNEVYADQSKPVEKHLLKAMKGKVGRTMRESR